MSLQVCNTRSGPENASLDRSFALGPEVLHHRAGAEVLIIHLITNQTFALSVTAARFWELIVGGQTARQAVQVLRGEFCVSLEQASDEAESLIRQLLAAGLIIEIESDGSPGGPRE